MPVPFLGRAIRRRHSAVDEERGGRVVARHIHGMYATIPKETDIKLCMMSQSHLCMFEEPLYPVEKN